jgi:hypothetical protein
MLGRESELEKKKAPQPLDPACIAQPIRGEKFGKLHDCRSARPCVEPKKMKEAAKHGGLDQNWSRAGNLERNVEIPASRP